MVDIVATNVVGYMIRERKKRYKDNGGNSGH